MINLGKPSIRNGRFCPIVWAKWAFQLFYNTNVTWPYSRYRNIYKYVFLGVFYRNRHHWWVFFSCLWTLKLPAGDWPQGGYQTTNLEELIWHNYIIQFCLDRNYRIMAVKMSYNSLFLVIHSISMGLVQYKHNWYNSGHNCNPLTSSYKIPPPYVQSISTWWSWWPIPRILVVGYDPSYLNEN